MWVRHDDGNWYAGWVTEQRRDDDGWRGWVSYSVAVGRQHGGWVHESRLRPREWERGQTASGAVPGEPKSPGTAAER